MVRRTVTAIFIASGFALALTEASVFEWWDDGLISAEDAGEMLNLLEEGNEEEACLLAETYSLEECRQGLTEEQSTDSMERQRETRKTRRHKAAISAVPRRPSLTPRGHVLWTGQTDSLGHLERHRFSIQMEFYRYRLRLGAQELLSYTNQGSEAHFGQVSTQEIHSHIPLDTLWGTSLSYPVGNFMLAGTLDTAQNIQWRLGYKLGAHPTVAEGIGKNASADFFCWNHRQDNSCGLQFRTSWGSFSGWWQRGQEFPLVKVQLQHSERLDAQSPHSKTARNLAWRVSAYIHGQDVPDQSHLSSNILKNKFWSTQTISYTDGGPWRNRISLNTRILTPLEASKAPAPNPAEVRLKLQTETGPQVLRGTASATCLDVAENCLQDDLKLGLSSTFSEIPTQQEGLSLQGSIKSLYSHEKGFKTPRLEAGASYASNNINKASISLVMPQLSPQKSLQIRTRTDVGTSLLQLSIAVTFKNTPREPIHPLHAYLQLKAIF